MRTLWSVIVLCACSEPLTPPTGPIHRYVVSSQQFPRTYTEASGVFGSDLTGDGIADSQFGTVMALLHERLIWPFDGAGLAIDRGDVIMLAELQTSAPEDPVDAVALTMFRGANPDPAPCIDAQDSVCRGHLQGDARFDARDAGELLLARRRELPITVRTGDMPLTFAFYGTPVELTLHDGQVVLDQLADTRLAGRIGGWIDREDVVAQLIPLFVQVLERRQAAECTEGGAPPDCGCPPEDNYNARYWLGIFDGFPKDCSITTTDVLDNSIISSLLSPDDHVDGVEWLSFGFGFEAVPAQFAP